MADKNIFYNPVRMGCMRMLSIFVFLAGCSAIGPRDDAVSILGRELAASVVHVQGNERPEQLNRFVQPGTVVMWLNTSGEDIRIVFPERTVTIACLNPVSFSVNGEGFFESRVLSPGAVASLCFLQPGLYAYVVERQADARREKPEGLRQEGTIVVQ